MIFAAADVAMVRNSPGGRYLSDELVLLLALAFFDDYILFPSAAEREFQLWKPPLANPSTCSTIAARIESGAGELVARMDERAEHTQCQHATGHGRSDNYEREATLETYERASTSARIMTDDELIERARKDVPESSRKARYANCDPHVNHNWDLTRALLRRIDRVEAEKHLSDGQLRREKRKSLLLAAMLGGAAAEGAKVAVVALIHALGRTAG